MLHQSDRLSCQVCW